MRGTSAIPWRVAYVTLLGSPISTRCTTPSMTPNARGRRGIAKNGVEPIAGDVKAGVRGPRVAIRSGPTGDVALVRMEAGGINPIELAKEVQQLSGTRRQGLCERRV